MFYLDTSFLIPYYIAEPSSAAVETVLQQAPSRSFVVSSWTKVEFVSSLARQVRMGVLRQRQAEIHIEALTEDIRHSYQPLDVNEDDYALAANLLFRDPLLGLRGPDALHLAIVGNRSLALYTLDQTLIKAALALGYEATDKGVR